MKKRPLIGITRPEEKPINAAYIVLWLAIWLAGGHARVITAKKPRFGEDVEGLLLGGGTDVFPGLFNMDPKKNYKYDLTRDALETKWLRRAEKENLPVFAICRGAQLMNVVNGGSLHMDVSRAYEKAHYPSHILGYLFFRKMIHLEKNTLIYDIFERERLFVNSIHKQSVNEPGRDLEITAREPNGVVQAIENPAREFFLGVQFHPELLIYLGSFRKLFRKFIEAAR